MCGIVGYTGGHQAAPILVGGLRRLEYRGYDSAGLATIDADRLHRRASGPGGCGRWRSCSSSEPAPGGCGISHTRWATHGPANDRNAHPHLGGRGGTASVAVVHNGVIENHARSAPRARRPQGFAFASQTDTEVIAHLIARELEADDDLFEAVQRALPRLEGTYGLGVVSPRRPGEVIGARFGSPLVVGLGEGEHFLASDPVAIAPHTARVAFLQDGEVVRLTPDDFEMRHLEHGPITPRIDRIDWKPDAVELGGHAHYMIKEIREQPETVVDACRGRLRRAEATAVFGGLNLSHRQLRRVRRIVFAACGTSWHAALVGEYLIERLAHLPVEVEYASEFRYRNAPLDDRTLVFVLSQSGETADTLGALREAQAPRPSDPGDRQHRRQHDRPRGRRRHLSPRRPRGRRRQHQGVLGAGHRPDAAGPLPRPPAAPLVPRRPGRRRRHRIGPRADRRGPQDRAADRGGRRADRRRRNALYLGRDLHFPVALEGRPEAQGDQLHPRRGLSDRRDEARPDRAGRPRDPVRLRRAPRLAARQDAQQHRGGPGPQRPDHRRRHRGGRRPSPSCPTSSCRSPTRPRSSSRCWRSSRLQLLAYHVARRRGCDIDKPRNLAKSVTVE